MYYCVCITAEGVKRWPVPIVSRKMDEKQKRLRTHVVKEIVETERVYCEQISFVKEVNGAVGRLGAGVVHRYVRTKWVGRFAPASVSNSN